MSTWKRMAGVVSLFVLAAGPAALADEAGATSSEVQAPSAQPVSVDRASSDGDEERQIQALRAEIEDLRAEVAADLAGGRQYLDQNLRPWR